MIVGQAIEVLSVYIVLFLLILSLFIPKFSRQFLWTSFLILLGLGLSLWSHLAFDHFHYAYVWRYSALELPLYLKLANLWGGEEGTLLFLAILLSGFAVKFSHYESWTERGVILLTLPFVFGLIFWHPFSLTSEAQLAHAPYQGMNAHLTKFWMAFHPPLIFITYLLLLVPSGAAAEMLVKGTGPWKEISLKYSRLAWVILSAGLMSGMWWAYEDYFYGQFWHWDPVQTASFVVWCFLTAYLHGLRGYRPDGSLGRILPALSLLTASAAIGSMLVTRNGELVSSHRYLGETSIKLLAFIALSLLITMIVALILSYRRRIENSTKMTESRFMIQIALWGFVLFGLMGCYFLGEAYVRALLDIPKDKPPIFFALIANVSSSDLVNLLKEQHQRWTVDNFGLNQILVPIVFVSAIFGGHRFLPVSSFKLRLFITFGALLGSLILAEYVRPLALFYDGTGITSVSTRRNFYLLDMLLGGVVYFSLSSLLYSLPIGKIRGQKKAYFNYIAPVGLIHMGVMIGLFSALCAMILDSNSIKKITFPDAYDQRINISEHHSLEIKRPTVSLSNLGDYSPDGKAIFRSVTDVTLFLRNDRDNTHVVDQGQTLFQDDRVPMANDVGPIRQYCETVDYRFARSSRSNSHMLNPFIYRGITYDLQIWLPAINYLDFDQNGQYRKNSKTDNPTEFNIVVKKFPLMTGLWFGLGLCLIAGLYYALFSRNSGAKKG